VIQEGGRGQGRAVNAKLMLPVSAGGHPSTAQPKAARSGFLSRSSYVAPSPQHRSLAKLSEAGLSPHPI